MYLTRRVITMEHSKTIAWNKIILFIPIQYVYVYYYNVLFPRFV